MPVTRSADASLADSTDNVTMQRRSNCIGGGNNVKCRSGSGSDIDGGFNNNGNTADNARSERKICK